jgi:hypothetical protein
MKPQSMKPQTTQNTQNDFLFEDESYLIRGAVFESNKTQIRFFSKLWTSSESNNREDY